MIAAVSGIVIVIGLILLSIDVFIPFPFPLPFIITFKMLGIGMAAIGLMILGARISQTGVGAFLDIPNTKRVILMHERRGKHSPNTFFIPAKLDDLEYIRAKNKIFKDTGGGFRIAGHDVRRTHEMIGFDIPEWLSDYFYQIKQKFGTNDIKEIHILKKALMELRPPVPGMDMEDQLRSIKLLKPIMDDPTRKQILLDMKLNELRNMEQLLFDGEIHHNDEVEKFIESATPNEISVLEKQKFLNEKMEEKHYRDVGEHNIGQWIGPVLLLMVGGAIAAAIVAGVFQ